MHKAALDRIGHDLGELLAVHERGRDLTEFTRYAHNDLPDLTLSRPRDEHEPTPRVHEPEGQVGGDEVLARRVAALDHHERPVADAARDVLLVVR